MDLSAALKRGTLARATRSGAYDAVVVGAGATGSLASLLLAEAGLEVLVLNAGAPQGAFRKKVRRLARRLEMRIRSEDPVRAREARRQPVQSLCYAWPLDPDAFVDDLDLPYSAPPGQPFAWIRSRLLGGRLAVPGNGRLYFRMGPDDLGHEAGSGEPWPISYEELAPWYAAVERRIGLAGGKEGIPWLPDSELAEVLDPSDAERVLMDRIGVAWPDFRPALARFAPPADLLESAAHTGRLTVREGAIAREVTVTSEGRVRGVRWVDMRSRRIESIDAPLVFLCASSLESTRLLLMSRSPDGAQGIGAGSGALGSFLMDHTRIVSRGYGSPLPPSRSMTGRCLYLPRFDARASGAPVGGRGFGVQLYHESGSVRGRSALTMACYAEMLPRRANRVMLHPRLQDAWGIPSLHIECSLGERERAVVADQKRALRELAAALDVELETLDMEPAPPGLANHECGTARMGHDERSSVLDANNQCWEARGLYLTDGACLPSQGTQNPTLTYLALTARACDHAVRGPP